MCLTQAKYSIITLFFPGQSAQADAIRRTGELCASPVRTAHNS
jgi:hypothetical protein